MKFLVSPKAVENNTTCGIQTGKVNVGCGIQSGKSVAVCGRQTGKAFCGIQSGRI